MFFILYKIIEKIENEVIFYDLSKKWAKDIYKYVKDNFDVNIKIEGTDGDLEEIAEVDFILNNERI